jgi:RNA polymerase sigma-70 factor (ECF subfamily)
MFTTPVSLLERLRQPDPRDAWDRLIQLYTPLLWQWTRRMGLQEADAADLLQEFFALLLRKLPQFSYDEHKSFRNWLRTVLRNCYRSLRRRRQVPVTGGETLAEWPDVDPAEVFAEEEYRSFVTQRALELMQADFEPATWQAFWQCTVLGRAQADVAAELGKTVGAVRAASFRVLSRLRQELKGMLD